MAQKVKATEFESVARGNGVPVTGDLFEGVYKRNKYRAEFYLEANYGYPRACLAGDSFIEKKTKDGWKKMVFPQTIEGDTLMNDILSAICPEVI